jgi:hypothetical protein
MSCTRAGWILSQIIFLLAYLQLAYHTNKVLSKKIEFVLLAAQRVVLRADWAFDRDYVLASLL